MKTADQVLSDLTRYIKEHGLQAGDKLPPERQLALLLGTSRPTLRKLLDRYESTGAIERRRKGGTVIVGPLDPALIRRQPQANIISFITTGLEEGQYESKQTYIQHNLLSKGYILNTYFSTKDRQDLDKEQQYLRSLFRINPKGLIVTASPHGNTNETLFSKLEQADIRVVHLHYYQEKFPYESFVLPDWYNAGAMAVSFLQAKGCKQVIFAHPSGNTPGIRILRKGIVSLSSMLQLELLPERQIGAGGDDKNGRLRSFISELPANTGIITSPMKAGQMMVAEMAYQYGGNITEQPLIAIDDCMVIPSSDISIPYINLHWEKRMQTAIDFLTNSENLPPIRTLIPPELIIPDKTLR